MDEPGPSGIQNHNKLEHLKEKLKNMKEEALQKRQTIEKQKYERRKEMMKIKYREKRDKENLDENNLPKKTDRYME